MKHLIILESAFVDQQMKIDQREQQFGRLIVMPTCAKNMPG